MRRNLVLLGTALVIAGCGDGSSAKPQAADAGGGTEAIGIAPGSVSQTPLLTTPITFDDAMRRTPPTITETVPCPFLSDETARATADTDFEMTRRRVSNEECVWNYNSGFAISAKVESVAESLPFAERQYNIDVPPILEPQSSPGQNAVLLFDTAWEKPRPYAFGFDLGDKRVFLNVTGMSTSLAQLQPAAEEIAAKLPAAPQIEPQRRATVLAYSLCSTWTEAGLLSLFDLPEGAPFSTQGVQTCSFEMWVPDNTEGARITVGLSVFESSPDTYGNLVEEGRPEVSGYDFPVLSRTLSDDNGVLTSLGAYIQDGAVVVSITATEGAMEAETKTLFDNVMARLVF